MKKYIVGFIVVVILAALARFAGQQVGAINAVDSVEQHAADQHMPSGFFGVKWLTSTAELRSIRPNVVADSDGMLAESVTFLDRPAKMSYYVKTGNVLMYAVHFKDPTSKEVFQTTNQALDSDFGPMSEPTNESDKYGQEYCSHRRSKRFRIDHCILFQGQTPTESIVFYRSKPNQLG